MSTANNTESLPVRLKRPATFDHLRRKQKPWQVLEVCLSMDAKRALQDAERKLEDAERKLAKDLTAAERDRRLAPFRAEVEVSKAEVDEHTEELFFESIGRARREALVNDHPPTQEDEEAAEEAYAITKATSANPEYVIKQPARFNVKSYSLALVAASCVVPKLSEDEWREVTDDWTDGEFQQLWLTALGVNQDGTLVSLGKSSSVLNGTNGSTKS
jgi:hypothetical protein